MFAPRSLAFLDGPSSNNTVGFVVGFSILAFATALEFIQAVLETRRDLYGKHSLKFLLRWACVALVVENATLAVLEHRGSVNTTWADIVYAMNATLAPSLLLSMFDVTYMIHKVRSIPFCGGIHVESRSNRNYSPAVALKLGLRLVALLLLVLGILVNYGILFDEDYPLAGRVGWVYLIQERDTLTSNQQIQIVLSLLPMAVVTVCCLYFSLALWRYGTTFSMVVYSSPFNPFCSPFFGTLALGGTQWFGERWFAILSHVGIFVFLETILLLLIQVNKDLQSENELVTFLHAIGTTPYVTRNNKAAKNSGDSSPSAAGSTQQQVMPSSRGTGDSKSSSPRQQNGVHQEDDASGGVEEEEEKREEKDEMSA